MRIPFTIPFILACGIACAQNTGTIRMLVDPGHNFSFVVDKKHRMQQREVKLGEGLHQLSVWAPDRMIVDTNVFVVADRTTDMVMRLPYSPEYVEYRAALGRLQSKRRVARTIPTVVTAGALIWTGINIGKYQKAHNALKEDQKIYDINVDPAAIRTLKEETIPQHNADLRAARTGLYTSVGVTAVSAGIMYYLYRRSSKWASPVMDDKQKVIFDGLVWVPNERGGMFHAGITIPLAR